MRASAAPFVQTVVFPGAIQIPSQPFSTVGPAEERLSIAT